ncbi:unnamed protein product [Rotaria socialis]|uniref:Uncharacterized protein n=1 Tax=Rotaria socialis TaxID=392032 RepID=A0A817VX83_9BILA|nr:unnamed protein product [Rotaria socialis]CAF3208432.1 unnamed protein product [Rotaria socialis]CAF3350085.1 unnamed protein product [Rotaria socialis]CAF3445947.1 unnamed protein product [Rotaria socialis]CAF3533454.1 unnamed protein product [Rotaria socialis]
MPKKLSKHVGSCVGYTTDLAADHLPINSRSSRKTGKSNGKTFYDDENYRWMLDCLDGGYEVCKDFYEYMQDYNNLEKKHIHNLDSHSTKWNSKIQQQSPYSSYHTTKNAQLQLVGKPTEEAKILRVRHAAIQDVIDRYLAEVEIIYPRTLFGTSHRHYRSSAMKDLFKAAHYSLSSLSDNLKKLREQEQSIVNSNNDGSYVGNNSNAATTKQLKQIRDKIAHAEKEYHRERENYCMRVRDIYEQCRILEKDRLNLIKETLIEFTKVAYSSEHVNQQRRVYEELMQYLNAEQDTVADLNFWAQNYRVYDSEIDMPSRMNRKRDDSDNDSISVRRMRTSSGNQQKNGKHTEENVQQSDSEDEPERSLADGTAARNEVK